jgi:hypothetical protein
MHDALCSPHVALPTTRSRAPAQHVAWPGKRTKGEGTSVGGEQQCSRTRLPLTSSLRNKTTVILRRIAQRGKNNFGILLQLLGKDVQQHTERIICLQREISPESCKAGTCHQLLMHQGHSSHSLLADNPSSSRLLSGEMGLVLLLVVLFAHGPVCMNRRSGSCLQKPFGYAKLHVCNAVPRRSCLSVMGEGCCKA